MRDKNTTVFIEARYRSNVRFGSGAESLGQRKQQKLLAAAAHYLQKIQSPPKTSVDLM
jgi:putative endonuclease